MQRARRWLTLAALAAWTGVLIYIALLIFSLGSFAASDVYWLGVMALIALAISCWVGFRSQRMPERVAVPAEGLFLISGVYLLTAFLTPHV